MVAVVAGDGCAGRPPNGATRSEAVRGGDVRSSAGGTARGAEFAATRDAFVDWTLADSPALARQLGLHDADGKVDDCSAEAWDRRILRLRRAQSDFDRIARGGPLASADDRLDLAILRHMIGEQLFSYDEMQDHRKHPGLYAAIFFSVEGYLQGSAPIEARARALVQHENAASAEVPHVIALLSGPLAKPIAKVEGGMVAGLASFVRNDVQTAFASLTDAALERELKEASQRFANELDRLAAVVKRWETEGDDSHVYGAAKYARLLAVQEGFEGTVADFKRLAEDDLAKKRALYDAARRGVTPTKPNAGELVTVADKLVRDARAFVVEKKIVTLPTDELPVVRESPAFMRWNGASIAASGPFEPRPWALFNITLPDPAWPAARRDAYVPTWGSLRFSGVVHEAMPGHFVQIHYRRRAPTRVQKMAFNYSFVEGWAHYTEQMMAEEGFGASDPQNRVGQLADALRRDCRCLASIGIHTEGMSVADAARLFVERCDQDEATAREQAERGTFDPGYFAYTFGKVQILKLRDEVKAKLGPRFRLQAFHDALLSHGSPPLPVLRERVLADLGVARAQ